MDIVAYTGEVLSRLTIKMESRQDAAFFSPYMRDIPENLFPPREREVLLITAVFDVHYLMFRHNGEFILVGPYLTGFIPDAGLDEERLNALGITKSELLDVPVVPQTGLFRPLMETLFDTLWGKGNYTWRDTEVDDSVSVSIYRDNMEYYDAEKVARRYMSEARLLDAVRRCDLRFIDNLFPNASMEDSMEKRNNNPVRNIQNYSIVMNTLLRKTAYEAGVSAFYVDRLSSAFGRRIEKVSTSQAISTLMREMLTEYALLIREYSWEGYPESIKKVFFIIDSRYREKITLDELAEAAGLSAPYLSRLFRDVTGKTVFEYINEVRISRSLELLRNPDSTIAQSAVGSGFEDQAYYTRTFRRVKGMTPSEWRKANTIR